MIPSLAVTLDHLRKIEYEHVDKRLGACTQAVAVMQFIAGDAVCLPLQPPLALTPPQLARVQRYAAAIFDRQAGVSTHLSQLQPAAAGGGDSARRAVMR